MKKILSRTGRVLLSLTFLAVCLGGGCTKVVGQVEISVDDWDYNDYANILTVMLTVQNTGDVNVKSVRCAVKVKSMSGTTLASEDVSFGSIRSGNSLERTITLSVSLSPYSNYQIKPESIDVEPETNGFGCSKPN